MGPGDPGQPDRRLSDRARRAAVDDGARRRLGDPHREHGRHRRAAVPGPLRGREGRCDRPGPPARHRLRPLRASGRTRSARGRSSRRSCARPTRSATATSRRASPPAPPTCPLGRMGDPKDVANLALFLASDESAWITGPRPRGGRRHHVGDGPAGLRRSGAAGVTGWLEDPRCWTLPALLRERVQRYGDRDARDLCARRRAADLRRGGRVERPAGRRARRARRAARRPRRR